MRTKKFKEGNNMSLVMQEEIDDDDTLLIKALSENWNIELTWKFKGKEIAKFKRVK